MDNSLKIYLPEISRRAKVCRELEGLTQTDVAEAAGVSHALVSQFENGKIASFWLLVFYIVYLGLYISDLKEDPIYAS